MSKRKEITIEPLSLHEPFVSDIENLLEACMLSLEREIGNLNHFSNQGKLSPPNAKDLTTYIELLTKLKKDQDLELTHMSDEEIKSGIETLLAKATERSS